ncbi:apiosidase-like domain-containing protein [Kordiimonas aestuarii]|uniref:apiosidase-like domain-containing protein n=1 Tax=Kordiimonas aestuarii TaxID=1005925 RepID=UPI0021CE8CDB|nr:DUF4038 domain-containing protein [Kordiimonas aestuarii]
MSLKIANDTVSFRHCCHAVSAKGHYLQYEDGQPFLGTGDTTWALFHRLDREDADLYSAHVWWGRRLGTAY